MYHVLYVESDSVQIAKYGFLCAQPKSIWFQIQDEEERLRLDIALKRLHRRGFIKLYLVSACLDSDESTLEDALEELGELDWRLLQVDIA